MSGPKEQVNQLHSLLREVPLALMRPSNRILSQVRINMSSTAEEK